LLLLGLRTSSFDDSGSPTPPIRSFLHVNDQKKK
jgi:hypothetical protein